MVNPALLLTRCAHALFLGIDLSAREKLCFEVVLERF